MKELIDIPYIKYSILSVSTLLIALVLTRILRFVLNRFIKNSSRKLKVDPTQFNFLKNAVSFVVFLGAFMFIFYSIPQLKALSLTLFAGAGIITAIILFASQAAFANIVSGIFIVIFKPFRVNDIVDVGNLSKGKVEDITLRHTVIRSYENRRLIIPNSVISSEVIVNSSIVDEFICNFLELGISYDSDINKAMEIIRNESQQHPEFIDNRTAQEKKGGEPSVRIRVLGYGESSIDLRAYIWSRDHDLGFLMKSDLYKSIKEKFDKNGIEIPFPYRTIVYKEK